MNKGETKAQKAPAKLCFLNEDLNNDHIMKVKNLIDNTLRDY